MEMRISLPGGARVDAAYKGFVIRIYQPVHLGVGSRIDKALS